MAGTSKAATAAKQGDTDTPEEPTTDASNETPVATKRVVKYVGTADVREIDAASWKNARVEDQGKVVWDASNDHTVDAAELNDAALEYLDKKDEGFKVMEIEDK